MISKSLSAFLSIQFAAAFASSTPSPSKCEPSQFQQIREISVEGASLKLGPCAEARYAHPDFVCGNFIVSSPRRSLLQGAHLVFSNEGLVHEIRPISFKEALGNKTFLAKYRKEFLQLLTTRPRPEFIVDFSKTTHMQFNKPTALSMDDRNRKEFETLYLSWIEKGKTLPIDAEAFSKTCAHMTSVSAHCGVYLEAYNQYMKEIENRSSFQQGLTLHSVFAPSDGEEVYNPMNLQEIENLRSFLNGMRDEKTPMIPDETVLAIKKSVQLGRTKLHCPLDPAQEAKNAKPLKRTL
jgi:hypothetical protein